MRPIADLDADEQPTAVAATASRRATPAGRDARPTRPGRRASRCRDGGGGRCGGTRRPRDSGCRRTRTRRAPRPRCTPGCPGSRRRHRRPATPSAPETGRAAPSARCRPRSCRRRPAPRRRTGRTSRSPSPRRRCRAGSSEHDRRRSAGSTAERRVSTNCSAPAGRSSMNRWSPRSTAAGRRAAASARRGARASAARAGSRAERRVSSFWAATQATPRRRHRPPASGRGRERRCRDSRRRRPHAGSAGRRSTTSCGRTKGGRSAAAHVGALAVVRLGAAQPGLRLLGLLRHSGPAYGVVGRSDLA